MNEEGDSPKLRAVFRVYIWNQRWRAKSRSTELRMGSHGMRTHLASLTIPPQLGRTDSQTRLLKTARTCNIVSSGRWYIIFFGFV